MEEQKMKAPSGGQKSHGFAIASSFLLTLKHITIQKLQFTYHFEVLAFV